jgi:hypothetical protein
MIFIHISPLTISSWMQIKEWLLCLLHNMMETNGLMQSIIECDNCGSSEQDGRMFTEVCGICYLEDCDTPMSTVTVCSECNKDNDIIDPGESLFT